MDRANIDKIGKTPEDRILLAKVWDKIHAGMRRNIPANSCFLSLREQEMVRYLFGQQEYLFFFGGYEDAERKMLIFLPDYMDASAIGDFDAMVCIRAAFYEGDSLSHRDFLGALMGAGIARETVGDICVQEGSCDFFVTAEIAPYILQELTSAGRTKLQLKVIPLCQASIPPAPSVEIRDTVASLRLDSVISSGFRISRGAAVQHIAAGKAAIDGLPCDKCDKIVSQGAKISLRGFGKIQLTTVSGPTKKGRISVVIDRYV